MVKYSQYNVRIPMSENTDVLYNTASDKFIAIRRNTELKDISELSESLTQLLLDNQMIVPEELDERGEVIAQWEKRVKSETDFFLIVNPTLRCNFNCWYCYENHKNPIEMSADVINKIKGLIDSIVPEIETLDISFFGGEPLLEFSRIVEPLIFYAENVTASHNKEVRFSFTTNGFLLTPEMIDCLAGHRVSFMQITLDGGRKSHNKTRISKTKDSFGTITSNIVQLLDHKIYVTLRINVTPDNIDDCGDILNWINGLTEEQTQYISVNVQQVWQTERTEEFADKIDCLLDSFTRCGIRAYPAIMDNLRQMCYADRANTLLVNTDGNIFKCTAVDFENAANDSNIFSDTWKQELSTKFEKRLKKRFANHNCLTCRIFPLCMGGCHKRVVSQSETDYCLFTDREEAQKYLVLSIIKDRVRRDALNKLIHQ